MIWIYKWVLTLIDKLSKFQLSKLSMNVQKTLSLENFGALASLEVKLDQM